ncbi:heterokaryon incompatibility protein-domain-containing protein [Rhexocercosporidium sp. MPI-PUGE-AT-0058]|nr:heterokaryon incompatibility protein-domain-containing protein [Rhexocercosporidium sp. MPI-PUGE-AT-0058]
MPYKPQSWSPYESLALSKPSVPSLRIFHITPGDPGEPLHGELSVETMRSVAGKYSALSYTWGTATEQRWIVINGKPFHIQPSLYAALHAVRSPVEDLPLWVDAICINQNNTKEINHQLGMMG